MSAAVLRRANSGKILKILACYLEKVVLAHHPKYMELLKKEGLGFFVGGLCNFTQRWDDVRCTLVAPLTLQTPRSALQSNVSTHPRLRTPKPSRESADCQQDAFSTTGKRKIVIEALLIPSFIESPVLM